MKPKLNQKFDYSVKTEVDFMLEENCMSHSVLSVKGSKLPFNCIFTRICMKQHGKLYYHIE